MAKTVVCVDAYGKEYEVSLKKLEWRPSVYAVVVKDDEILLSKQFDGYELPGDGMEIGEMPEETAIRETKEETGIIVESPRLVGVASNFFNIPNIHRDNHFVRPILMYYQCKLVGGSLSTDGFDEHEKTFADMPEWIPLNQLDDLTISSSIDFRKYVKQVLKS